MPRSRIGVVVDGENLSYQLRDHMNDARFDIHGFLRYCAGYGTLTGCTWFQADRPGNSRFFDILRRTPQVALRTARPVHRLDGTIKCDQDVAIAVEAMRMAETADLILFVTGDGDFIQVIEPLLDSGRRVMVMSHGSSLDARYRQLLPAYDLLDLAREISNFGLVQSGWSA